MINRYCENCGKILNKKTLICDACGTDYNEKPKCEHLFNQYTLIPNQREQTYTLGFRCQKCRETIELNCDRGLIHDIFK